MGLIAVSTSQTFFKINVSLIYTLRKVSYEKQCGYYIHPYYWVASIPHCSHWWGLVLREEIVRQRKIRENSDFCSSSHPCFFRKSCSVQSENGTMQHISYLPTSPITLTPNHTVFPKLFYFFRINSLWGDKTVKWAKSRCSTQVLKTYWSFLIRLKLCQSNLAVLYKII